MAKDPFAALVDALGPQAALRVMNVYPPYVAAGIRVDEVAGDLTWCDVSMRLYPWTKNAMGTQFGGSLYAMCDPWFMLLLIARIGRHHVVWDKRASIDFIAPGRGTVRARFAISHLEEAAIVREAAEAGVSRPVLHAEVKASDGSVVCRVEKTLSVRRRKRTT